MENNKNKPNWFVRSLILMLGFILILLVVSKFYFFEPKGDISNNLIVLIVLLIILFLSEIFDSFSLGQFLSLKKDVSERNERIKELRDSNEKLLNLVINNNFSQKQTISNTTGLSVDEIAKVVAMVTRADPTEVARLKDEDEKISSIVNKEIEDKSSISTRKRLNHRKLEKLVLELFLNKENLQSYTFINEAQIVLPKRDIDPISLNSPVFDGYLEKDNYEIFIEVKLHRSFIFPILREQLYFMLSKLYHYRLAKNVNAYLTLILVKIPDESNNRVNNNTAKFLEVFAPSLNSGLLRVEQVELNDDQMAGLYSD